MKTSALITELQRHMQESGSDPEVTAQTRGCCRHGHTIVKVEFDIEDNHPDEIVLRCE